MTGYEVALCLGKLGHNSNSWRDETSPESVFNTWDNAVETRTYKTVAAMLTACETVYTEVRAEEIKEHRKNALIALDPLVAQIQRYDILGKSSEEARVKLATKMAEIDILYPEQE